MARPRKMTPDEAQAICDSYFATHLDRPTVFGLCLALDVERHTLVVWAHEGGNGLSAIARKALSKIAAVHEANLFNSKGGGAAGSIFWLKCHDMTEPQAKDRTEVSTAADGNGVRVVFERVQNPATQADGQ